MAKPLYKGQRSISSLRTGVPPGKLGNSFTSLEDEQLAQISDDICLELRVGALERQSIIANLKNKEIEKIARYENENPEILLPANLEHENFRPLNGGPNSVSDAFVA